MVHVHNHRQRYDERIRGFFCKVAEILDSQPLGKFNQIVSSRTIMMLNKFKNGSSAKERAYLAAINHLTKLVKAEN
jgi:hypothetical protein